MMEFNAKLDTGFLEKDSFSYWQPKNRDIFKTKSTYNFDNQYLNFDCDDLAYLVRTGRLKKI